MPDSTSCHCQVLAVRSLDFLLGHSNTALAVARAHRTQARATQPDALCALTAYALAPRANGAKS